MNRLIYSYDQLYLGNTKYVTIFKSGTDKLYEEYAVQIIKYAIEHYLGWTPQMAFELFDEKVIARMKLGNIVEKIRFPQELNSKRDYFYVISACYPDLFPYNKDDSAIIMYDRVISGKMDRLPKNFFLGSDGQKKLIQCFRFLLNKEFSFTSYDEIYEHFSHLSKANDELDRFGLFTACSTLFNGVPLDLVHAALTEEERNEALYQKLRFELFYRKRGVTPAGQASSTV